MMGDIPVGGWVDRWLPPGARPYARLARLDRPIGAWLLLWPCWWSIALAGKGILDLHLMVLFGVGALSMRAAGCVINDLWDRDIDPLVARTAVRPLASGQVSVAAAFAFLGLLLAISLAVVVQMSVTTVIWALAAMVLVVPYPLMKRITYWPQAWLGLTFNWGALLGWVAVTDGVALPALVLYAGGFFWTLAYDTIYALQDKEDDVTAGVKSSALALGRGVRPAVAVFFAVALGLILWAGLLAGLGPLFPALMIMAALHAAWQVVTLAPEDGPNCLVRFKSNRDFGLLVFAAICGSALIPVV